MHSPDLFVSCPIQGVSLQSIPRHDLSGLQDSTNHKLPIGKRIEQEVKVYLSESDDLDLLAHSVQVAENRITIGELDFIIQDKVSQEVQHLELVHKFYIYDPQAGDNDIDRLVGPNRKDRLRLKLNKLAGHQFPLLYNPLTKPHLSALNIKAEELVQSLCFRGEVFLPIDTEVKLELPLNPDCVSGTYCQLEELPQFLSQDCQLFISQKHDWIRPMDKVDSWLNKEQCLQLLHEKSAEKRAIMIWIKEENTVSRHFVLFDS